MMRLWRTSYARKTPVSGAGALSTTVHLLIIAGWVAGTRPIASLAPDSLANRPFYIPPPDRPVPGRGTHETVHFISLTPGPAIGPGPMTLDAREPVGLSQPTRELGSTQEQAPPQAAPPEPAADSVFTVLEVDSAVTVRSEFSVAPAYPKELLEKHVEGLVVARYVVDTTGLADPESFEVVQSTNPAFTQSVRTALAGMRFAPAKIGSLKVRQLVEQPFAFRITTPPPAAPSKKP